MPICPFVLSTGASENFFVPQIFGTIYPFLFLIFAQKFNLMIKDQIDLTPSADILIRWFCPLQRGKTPTTKEEWFLGLIQNYISWFNSSSCDLGSEKYIFLIRDYI